MLKHGQFSPWEHSVPGSGKELKRSSGGLLNSACIKYLTFLETLPPKLSSQYPSLALPTFYTNL